MSNDFDSTMLIAKAAHSILSAYNEFYGEEVIQFDKIKDSVCQGTEGVLAGRNPGEAHASWIKYKQEHGWVHGTEKNFEKKTHPCMVDFEELPPEQQVKDTLFCAIVKNIAEVIKRTRMIT